MELTLDQHLMNIEIAVVNHKATFEELVSIRTSFNHVKELVLKPKEEPKEK
jgi:hypothetical protein